MKHLLLLVFSSLFMASGWAQTSPRFMLQGQAVDTASAPLLGATVMLLAPQDSSLVSYARTDEKGAFAIKNVKRGPYLLKITYVGLLPHNQTVTPVAAEMTDLGTIKLKPISKELMEVVVRTARAPLNIKGDTIEYNAAAFKVPPGSTVEELLRKLPGVQIDQEGNIRAQGQEVKRVTVDGKSFFGNDPKMATKNLPAEAVSKVQVFTDKTEQAKITGVDDGKKEKTVNLELKDSFKKGGFGKITGGLGSDLNASPDRGDRVRSEVKGNYNRFDTKQQFSVVGLANNTNQTGLSWNDYQDFRGSNSFNWNDEADFGFSSGNRYFFSSDDEESLTIPITGGRGRGFSDNVAGGANYNYDTKKTKLSSNYYFSRTRLTLDALRNRETFLTGNTSVLTNENSDQLNTNGSHRGTIRFEQVIDSLNTLVVLNNTRFTNSSTRLMQEQRLFRNAAELTTRNVTDNSSAGQSLAMANTLLFRHKFRKKGRNFAFSASFLLNQGNSDLDLNAQNEFYQASVTTPTVRNVRQYQTTTNSRNEYKTSLLYVEPVSKKWFWESFYNFSLRQDVVDRDVFDKLRESPAGQMPRLDSLSRYYRNNYLYNRLGSGLRYSYKGLNLSLGAAAFSVRLDGEYAPDQTARQFNQINRTFSNVLPNVSFNYDLKNNRYVNARYDVNVRLPTSRDLQPIIDNTNQLFIREGNPDLLPALTHNLGTGYSYFNPGSFVNYYLDLNYAYNVNQIIYNQTVDPQTLITRTKPGNISGGQSVNYYTNINFPLRKTKATLGLGSSGSIGRNITFINAIRNLTNTQTYNFRTRLELTPKEWFTAYLNADWGITDSKYSVNTAQNQIIYNYNYQGDMNIRLPREIYFNANLNYRVFLNRRFGFNQQVPILNLSAYKLIGKEKRWEVRGTVFDALNRNLGVSQQAFQNFVSEERVQTISRYYLLSLTYNMRGIKPQMRRNNGF